MFHGVHFLDYLLTDEEVCSFEVHRVVPRNIISIVKQTRCINVSNLFYFWNDTLHVSDGLSVHHQEFSNRHLSNRYCQADSSICLTNASCCLYSLELLTMDGKTVRIM